MTHRGPGAPERLLQSALSEFARHGPGGARTDRIADRAGVNKQLIHYYFHSKAGLYEAAVRHAASAVADQLSRIPLVGLTAVERLRRLVLAQFHFLREHPDHTTLLLGAPDGGTWGDVALAPLTALLHEGQATGFFRDDLDPESHARLALLLTLGYFASRGLAARWGEPEKWAERAAELIVRGSSW
ncbi:MAG TPA: TetR/AcrR family transcriptional regulator [Gemmatimonadales bacterium]|nr:TetR/AcrR family transcriptional regulator [Gemmatimonadales bacterium]